MGLLDADPSLTCDKAHATEVPVKLKAMQVGVRAVFGHQWRRNAKGTANQVHEGDDAIIQTVFKFQMEILSGAAGGIFLRAV